MLMTETLQEHHHLHQGQYRMQQIFSFIKIDQYCYIDSFQIYISCTLQKLLDIANRNPSNVLVDMQFLITQRIEFHSDPIKHLDREPWGLDWASLRQIEDIKRNITCLIKSGVNLYPLPSIVTLPRCTSFFDSSLRGYIKVNLIHLQRILTIGFNGNNKEGL